MPAIQKETVNEKTYWYTDDSTLPKKLSAVAYLLSIFDEYTIAYNDRSDLSAANDIERMITMGNRVNFGYDLWWQSRWHLEI